MAAIDVIKYEGDNRTFVWKHPREDFNTSSQLIVHESQEAIFFLNGQALDSFGPGRHTLETQNIPLLNKIANLPSGRDNPFHAEVYFINQTVQLGIGWGTNSHVHFMEPTYNFPLYIGASGDLGLKVENSRKLLVKIVGTEAVLSQEKLVHQIKSYLQTHIKTSLASAIIKGRLNIFELDAHLENLSHSIRIEISKDLEDYGLSIPQMQVTTIVRPEGDPIYEQFKSLYFQQYAAIKQARINQEVSIIDQETDARQTVIDAQALADKRAIEGFTYQQERQFDVAEKIAGNEAVGEFSNMGIGLGVMAGIGGPLGTTVGTTVADTLNATSQPSSHSGQLRNNVSRAFCPICGFKFNGPENFCPQCGKERTS